MGPIYLMVWLLTGTLGISLLSTYPTISIIMLGLFIAVIAIVYPLALRGGAPFTAEVPVYTASRWLYNNIIWPTQVAVFPSRIVRHQKHFIGATEESINITQIASVALKTKLIWSDIIIESSGGTEPIVAHGHYNADAKAIKAAIETFQQQHFRQTTLSTAPPTTKYEARSTIDLYVRLTLYLTPEGPPSTALICSTTDPYEFIRTVSSLLQTGGPSSTLTVQLTSLPSPHTS